MQRIDVAVIGAGPYGLSLAAHLRRRGIHFRFFGKAMDTWRSHMPKNMMLKSEGFASNISGPDRDSTLKAYCRQHQVPYADRGLPIKIADFIAYADWFREKFAPELEETHVSSLNRAPNGFVLELESGETIIAGKVVLAVGVSRFSYIPEVLSHLPPNMATHSYDHRDVEHFKDRDVVVVGAGASAINLAHDLDLIGCHVQILARCKQLQYNTPPPGKQARTLRYKLRNPPSAIGQGWRSYFCSELPQILYRLPRRLRERAVKSHIHAAGGWYMREKVQGRVPQILGHQIARAEIVADRVQLHLVDGKGQTRSLTCDHVIAATGYRVDIDRLTFLEEGIRRGIADNAGDVALSSNFETKVPGLYAVGMTAMDSFGPVLRFVVGSKFTSPRLAAHLRRRLSLERVKNALSGGLEPRTERTTAESRI